MAKNTITVSLSIYPELWLRLQDLAKGIGISTSKFTSVIIEAGLRELDRRVSIAREDGETWQA